MRSILSWSKAMRLACFGALLAFSLHLFTPNLAVSSDLTNLIQQGRQHFQAGQFYDATQNLEQAAHAYATRRDALNQAIALTYLALSYQQLGQLQLAQSTISQSLALVPATGGSRSQQQVRAQALTAQGQIQLASGQPEQALASWQQAQADYQMLGDQVGEFGSQINQIQALQSLGYYRWATKQIETLESQLAQSPPELQMLGWRSLGNVLRNVGQLEASKTALETSWQLAQTLPSSSDRAAVLLSLGNTATAFGDRRLNQQLLNQREYCPSWNPSAEAEPYYDQAIQYYQRSAAQSPATPVGVKAKLNALNLQLKLNQSPAAEELQQLREQINQLPVSRSTIYAKINFTKDILCYSKSKNISNPEIQSTVTQLLAPAIQQAYELKDQRAYAYALGSLGQMEETLGEVSLAQEKTRQALEIAEHIQATDIAYQWEWQMARLLRPNNNIQQSLAYYQAAFNSLKALRGDLTALDTDLQFSFRETVEPFHREYVDLLLQNPNQANLKQSRDVIEALQLAELDDFFRDACSDAKPEQIDRIADRQDATAAIIYPILLSDRLEIILKLPGQPELHHYVTPETAQTIAATLKTLRTQLEEPHTRESVKLYAKQVYDWLIQPLDSTLAETNIQTLVFVLDGELRNIPTAALFDGEHYLVERYAVAVTPGLQLLDPRPLQTIQPRLLAGGLVEPNPELAGGFGKLTNVPDELAAVQAIVPRSIQLLNQNFTKEQIGKTIQAQPMTIVHLATHGKFSSNLAETFILAYDTRINVNELQTVLQNRSATELEAIELLVLSACDTAKGEERATLGMAGIAVRSGARSTLASLWKADDQATAQLISEFYRQLFSQGTTTNKAIALQKAQISLLSNPNFHHPRDWAPFILLGNWL